MTVPETQVAARNLLDALRKATSQSVFSFSELKDLGPIRQIVDAEPEIQIAVIQETIDRLGHAGKKCRSKSDFLNIHFETIYPEAELFVSAHLLRRNLPWTEDQLVAVLNRQGDIRVVSPFNHPHLPNLIGAIEKYVVENAASDPLRKALERISKSLDWKENNAPERKLIARIQAILTGPRQTPFTPGEAWSDSALADLKRLRAGSANAWNALLLHCQTAGKGKFSGRWRKEAESLFAAVGFDSFKEHVLRWFPLVDKPRTQPINRPHQWAPDPNNLIIDPHVELLRGLVWCCAFREDADLARAVARLALSAYRKIPQKGPRLVSLGNACITALGMMPGRTPIGQLAVLKIKVKFGTAQKEIEKAFNAAAEREGLPRDEVEELAVPAYALEEVGVLHETLGDHRVELLVDGSSAALHWSKDGKPLKSVPAAVKKEHADEFKELQASLKDINAMLPAQRERIDTLFLAQKSWPIAVWRERYLDHPLIGTIARQLIWEFGSPTVDEAASFVTRRTKLAVSSTRTAGIWLGDKLVGSDDQPLTLADDTTVSLWHPINHSTDEILAWRGWLERHEVVQPFKQAHREVYILTDAERRTGTYSNRFAAHVLRQHQFNALCLARGWKNKLRLMVDAEYPPAHRLLPQWNLRAEYWVEGAGTEYGTDTNEAGVYNYLTTDQVRFYRIDAAQLHAHAGGGGYTTRWNPTDDDEPLPLDQVPPLVFSEIMRDVDLFVGVASVGNDPNWADGGPGGQYRDYWQSYSFGELSATAQTRKALLERLIPRLKIAERCSLADRFLKVRGSIRTYKIHLGSGNILMEPNDQYLCIVPKQSASVGENIRLPFEGDATLSIILSKAFLLADDAKIMDPTIVSQLKK